MQLILYRPDTDRFSFVNMTRELHKVPIKRVDVRFWFTSDRKWAEPVEEIAAMVGCVEHEDAEIGERIRGLFIDDKHSIVYNDDDYFFSSADPLSDIGAYWTFWDGDLPLYGPAVFYRRDGMDCERDDLENIVRMRMVVVDETEDGIPETW